MTATAIQRNESAGFTRIVHRGEYTFNAKKGNIRTGFNPTGQNGQGHEGNSTLLRDDAKVSLGRDAIAESLPIAGQPEQSHPQNVSLKDTVPISNNTSARVRIAHGDKSGRHQVNASKAVSSVHAGMLIGGLSHANFNTTQGFRGNAFLNTTNRTRIIRVETSGRRQGIESGGVAVCINKTFPSRQGHAISNKASLNNITKHNKTAGFIHIGKSGGSSLSLQLQNGCHSFVKKHCSVVQNETIISELVTDYYHSTFQPRMWTMLCSVQVFLT